ncbi:hypothetical protein [Halolamina sp.]|jgi:hypothetical protein|uniref:hypothetical protein n=1 Tax=Halolamina sp. TaxID=1940283 RepID=UPI000223BAFD|nr:hypothetical protein Halar_3646 [halophilic archaeon DL31]
MSLAEIVPLMKPGQLGRNIAVGVGYFITIPFWLPLLPFIVFALVWRDTGGFATSLSSIPGISEGAA